MMVLCICICVKGGNMQEKMTNCRPSLEAGNTMRYDGFVHVCTYVLRVGG